MRITRPASILRGVSIIPLLLGISYLAYADPAPRGSAAQAGDSDPAAPLPTPQAGTTTQMYLPLMARVIDDVELVAGWSAELDGGLRTVFLPNDPVEYYVTIDNHTNSAKWVELRWLQAGACGEWLLSEKMIQVSPGIKDYSYQSAILDCQGIQTITVELTYKDKTTLDAYQHIITSPFQSFDMCSLPSAAQMQTWWNVSPYYTINLYLGGISVACKPPNLNQTWLSQVTPQGWTYTLTWVGPQAPCTNFKYPMSPNAATAKIQGRAEADAAVAAAEDLGFTSSQVIYYDLEGYSNQATTSCKAAVDSFMQGWVERIHELGFSAGAYGGACSSFVADWWDNADPPDDVWLAHWYISPYFYAKYAHVWNTPCVANGLWPSNQRLKQYVGDHQETWGGVGPFTIDSNILNGAVATFQSGLASPGANLGPLPPSDSTGTSSAGSGGAPIRAMGLVTPDFSWALRGDRLFRTLDGGNSWLEITPLGADGDEILGVSFPDPLPTDLTPENSVLGWLVQRSVQIDGMVKISLLRTTGGGSSWADFPLPLSTEEAASIAAATPEFLDAQTGWIAVKLQSGINFSLGRLFATQDGGQTWQERSLPLGGPVKFIDKDTGWVAGGPGRDRLFHTRDGGQTWEEQFLPLAEAFDFESMLLSLPQFENEATGWLPVTLVSEDGSASRFVLFRTDNGGETWSLDASLDLEPGSRPAVSLPFSLAQGDRWWAGAPEIGQLFHAAPGREAGHLESSGLSGNILALDFGTNGAGWAIEQEGSCEGAKLSNDNIGGQPLRCELHSRLMASHDGGQSWVEVTPPE